MPKNSIFGRERHKVDTKLTHDLSWEDRDAIDGWTISESFVSTIVGGRPVKMRLEDKIAQLLQGQDGIHVQLNGLQ